MGLPHSSVPTLGGSSGAAAPTPTEQSHGAAAFLLLVALTAALGAQKGTEGLKGRDKTMGPPREGHPMAQPLIIHYAPPASHQLFALRPGAAKQPHAAQPVAGRHHVVRELGEQQGRGLCRELSPPLPPLLYWSIDPTTAPYPNAPSPGVEHDGFTQVPKGDGTPHPAVPIPHPLIPPFHLPLPPGVELAEVFHVDGGTAPFCCLFPVQGLEGRSCGIITAPPPHVLSTRQPVKPSYVPPFYLTLIQGCTRHSDAVIRSLQQRGL